MQCFIFQIGNNFSFKSDLEQLWKVLLFRLSLLLQKDKIVQDVGLDK